MNSKVKRISYWMALVVLVVLTAGSILLARALGRTEILSRSFGIKSSERSERPIQSREAMYYEKLSKNNVRCQLCPNRCFVAPGQRGLCEGGQMPLQRRVPKRGFTNIFKKDYALINIKDLNRFEAGEDVTPEVLIEAGLIKARDVGNVKVLGQGEISQAVYVKAHRFSKSARTKIESAGGRVELI